MKFVLSTALFVNICSCSAFQSPQKSQTYIISNHNYHHRHHRQPHQQYHRPFHFHYAQPNENDDTKIILPPSLNPSIYQVIGIYALAPIIPTIILPMLTQNYKSTQESSALLAVLVSKRLCLYILATIATSYAGWRAAATANMTAGGPGESLDALNREILRGETNTSLSTKDKEKETKDVKGNDNDEEIFALLDDNENIGTNIALVLPLILTVALSISYFLIQQQNGGDENVLSTMPNFDFFDRKEIVKAISFVSNFALCLLFTSVEYRSAATATTGIPSLQQQSLSSTSSIDASIDTGNDKDIDDGRTESDMIQKIVNLPNILALGTVLIAFSLPLSQAWACQNAANIAIAVTVTRALAPFFFLGSNSDTDDNEERNRASIQTIALALVGLSIYDLCSVFGTSLLSVQAASASSIVVDNAVIENTIDSTSTIMAAKGSSVMETVARAKLEGPWQPGLLEMVLVGRVSDALGLGDIVFPACLVAWGYSFDKVYAYAAIGGYVIGSILTELVSIFGPMDGLPALIFITPAMLASVSLLALKRGELETIWNEKEK